MKRRRISSLKCKKKKKGSSRPRGSCTVPGEAEGENPSVCSTLFVEKKIRKRK